MKATKSNRLYFQLWDGAEITEEGGFGLLPTPIVMDTNCGDLEKIDTRRAKAKASKNNGNGFGMTIGELSNRGLLPTPTADDNPAKNTGKRNQDGLQKRAFQVTGKTSQLNPRFVMEMMGFPPDWTELPFLSGETKVSKVEATQ